MEFQDRLKAARKHSGLRQAELGRMVGIDQTSISDLERGKSKGTAYTAQIASACGVSAIWLAEGKGEMVPYDHGAALDRLADEVEVATGLRPISGPELLAREKAKKTGKLAQSLAALASPRSVRALERIILAADSGRLTEEDLILLEKIADRIAQGASDNKEGPNNRISRMIKNAAKTSD